MTLILIVDAVCVERAKSLFAGIEVIGIPVERQSVADAAAPFVGRSVMLWCHYADDLAKWIAPVAEKLGIVALDKTPMSFGNNIAAARAYIGANVSRYETPKPGPGEPTEAERKAIEAAEKKTLDDSRPVDLNEHALADRFSQQNPMLRYVAGWGKWMGWSGSQWLQDDTLATLDTVRAVCVAVAGTTDGTPSELKKLKSAHTRNAVETLARADRRHAATTEQWDRDLWALNTPGGIVDLLTGALRAALLGDYATKMTAVAPSGECPQWLTFLRTVCDFDDELVSFLQRVIGYCLTGDTREQCLFFLYGTGANGKGTFVNTLTRLFGQYATTAGMDVLTESKHDRHPQELARLRGARMVCAQESEQGRRWAEARIKALTGGDVITARFMRQDDFEFVPQFKLVVAGNHKPGLRNTDEAMRRRLHLVPFTVTIPVEQRDQQLAAKLWAEASGILQWAIDGCIQWQKTGLNPPTCVRIATEEYLKSQDTFLQWREECTQTGTGSTRTSELFRNYRSWIESRGEFCCAQGRFNELLEHAGHGIKRIHQVPFALGIVLLSATQDVDSNVEF